MEKNFSKPNTVSTSKILRGYNGVGAVKDVVKGDLPNDNWMNHKPENVKAVNFNELTSLTALIAYIAHVTDQSEFRVERQLADRFNVPNVKCLPADKYDNALRFLVDQVPPSTTSIS